MSKELFKRTERKYEVRRIGAPDLIKLNLRKKWAIPMLVGIHKEFLENPDYDGGFVASIPEEVKERKDKRGTTRTPAQRLMPILGGACRDLGLPREHFVFQLSEGNTIINVYKGRKFDNTIELQLEE